MPEDLAGPLVLIRNEKPLECEESQRPRIGADDPFPIRCDLSTIDRAWVSDRHASLSCIGKKGHSDSFELTELMLLATVAIVGAAAIVLHDPISVNRNAIRVI